MAICRYQDFSRTFCFFCFRVLSFIFLHIHCSDIGNYVRAGELEIGMTPTWKRTLTALAFIIASCQCFVVPNRSLRLQSRLVGSSAVDKVNTVSSLTRQRRVLAKSSFMDGSENIQKPPTSVDAMNSVAALNAVRGRKVNVLLLEHVVDFLIPQ